MSEYEAQVRLVAVRIRVICDTNAPPYIHCSKINSFLLQIKNVENLINEFKFDGQKKMTNIIKTNIASIMSLLDQFQQLHSQCTRELCAQFALTVSMQSILTEISAIRKGLIQSLETVGMVAASKALIIDKNEIESQDKVDIKRISVILNQLQLRPDLGSRPDIVNHLKNRLHSLDSLGITTGKDDITEIITIPELPPSLNLVFRKEDLIIGQEIGVGQSGRVYRGILKPKKQDVAIKQLHCHVLSTFDLEMFRREVFTMAILEHPSLLKLCGYTAEPPYCLITEYMINGSLYDYLDKTPEALSPTERTLIALDIARGIEFLHSRGIIHRDLKSLNILLDEKKRAKICDFGLIRTKSKDPMTGLVGTAPWMAPEVLLSSPYYDEKVDVYSFGILLWELVTSMRPYEGEDFTKVTIEILENNKRPIIPDNIAPNLRILIEKCWDRDPEKRPSFHQIVTMLTDPLCQIPGCNIPIFMREAGIKIKHMYSSSSPSSIIRNRRLCRTLSDLKNNIPKDSFERVLKRITDSISIGHIEHFDNSINLVKSTIRVGNIDWKKNIPRFEMIIDSSPQKFLPRLIVSFFDILSIEDAAKYVNPLTVPKLLKNDDDIIVGLVQSQLAMHPNVYLLNQETVTTLFSFYAHNQQSIRTKSLSLIFTAINLDYDKYSHDPNVVLNILAFTNRKLSHQMLKILLQNLLKLLQNMDTMNIGIQKKIVNLQLITPEKLLYLVSQCIEEVFRFDVDNDFRTNVWKNSVEHFDLFINLFEYYLLEDEMPSNYEDMIHCLCLSSSSFDSAFNLLIQFCHDDDLCLEAAAQFLPIQSTNLPNLIRFYTLFCSFDIKDVPQSIFNNLEFYNVLYYIIDSDKGEQFLPLMKLDYVVPSLVAEAQIDDKLSDMLLSSERMKQLTTMKFMFVLLCKSDYEGIHESVQKLFEIMRSSDSSLGQHAYLCLAALGKFYTEDYNFDDLLSQSVQYVNVGTGFLQTASAFLIKTYLSKCQRIEDLATAFISSFMEANQHSLVVAQTLSQAYNNYENKKPEISEKLSQISTL